VTGKTIPKRHEALARIGEFYVVCTEGMIPNWSFLLVAERVAG
jgi:hypothetical protein